MLSLTHVFLRTFPSDLDRRENWIMCVIVHATCIVYAKYHYLQISNGLNENLENTKAYFFGLRTLIFELRTFRNIPESLLLCIVYCGWTVIRWNVIASWSEWTEPRLWRLLWVFPVLSFPFFHKFHHVVLWWFLIYLYIRCTFMFIPAVLYALKCVN